MDKPYRVQLSRRKGWRMPENTVTVTRPGKWGNPFNFKSSEYCWVALSLGCRGDPAGRQEASVKAFRDWIDHPNGRIAKTDFGVVIEGRDKKGRLKKAPIGARATAGLSPKHDDIRAELGGKNLACWCAIGSPCHADVLLELANR